MNNKSTNFPNPFNYNVHVSEENFLNLNIDLFFLNHIPRFKKNILWIKQGGIRKIITYSSFKINKSL